MSTFLTYNTDFNDTWQDNTGLDYLSAHGSVVSDAGIDRGVKFTGTDSIGRMNEISNIRAWANSTAEQRANPAPFPNQLDPYAVPEFKFDKGNTKQDRYDYSLNPHGAGTYGQAPAVVNGGHTADTIKDQYGLDETKIMSGKDATTEYGIDGHLSWTEPVSNIEAKVLNERKKEELAFNFVLEKAYGWQNVKGMSIEMGMALIDPVTIPLMFFPPLGLTALLGKTGFAATKVVLGKTIGTTAGRIGTGALGGFYGSTIIEPFIYAAADQEQAQYGIINSLLNVGFGTVAGGGLHFAGGKVYDGVRYIRHLPAKRHAEAFDKAAKQLANGQSVEVSPITHSSEEPQFKTPINDGDVSELRTHGEVGEDGPSVIDKGDSSQPVKSGSTVEYKPHSNTEESRSLYADLDNSGAKKLSGVKLKQIIKNDPELVEALASVTAAGKTNKIAFRIKTKEGHFVVTRTEGQSLKIMDNDQLGIKEIGELEFGERVHSAMMMRGIDMAEADIGYHSSVKLDEDGIHHIIDVSNVEFNPKMNQHDVVIAPQNEMTKLFEGDAAIGIFAGTTKKGDSGVNELLEVFNEGKLVGSGDKLGSFDEALLDGNLTKVGEQAGTQPGGIHIDNASGKKYYVKYPVENGKPASNIIKNEFMAAVLYRELGVSMPEPRLVGNDAGEIVGIASEMLPNSKMITPKQFAELPDDVQIEFSRHALIDMYLGNWDVVGNAPNFNLMLLPNGHVARIDPGGALIYRAQGGLKDLDAMNKDVAELKTMLDPKNTSGEVLGIKLGGLSPEEFVQAQKSAAQAIFSLDQKDIGAMVDGLEFTGDAGTQIKNFLSARRDILTHVSGFDQVSVRSSMTLGSIVANSVSSAKKSLAKMASQYKNNLNGQQQKVLGHYTSSGYGWMNRYLRGKQSTADTASKAAEVKKFTPLKDDPNATPKDILESYMTIMDSAIDSSIPGGLTMGLQIWRGGTPYTALNNVKGLSLQTPKDINTANAMVGGRFILNGYTSGGLAQSKSAGFMKSDSVWIRIKAQPGQKAFYTKSDSSSSFGVAETEMILPRNQEFIITGITPQAGKNAKHGANNGFIIEVDAVLPGQTVQLMPTSQTVKIAEQYKKQPSNAVADIDKNDIDLNTDTVDIKQATLKPDNLDEVADIDAQLAELTELINAEMANIPPKYIASLNKTLEDINTQNVKDVELAVDLYEAAKAASVCILKAGA